MEALRKLVDALAPTWERPKSDGVNYSTELAARQIREWHGNATIVDAVGVRPAPFPRSVGGAD